LEDTTFKLHPNSLFEDGTGPGLELVGGEFQPFFATAHPGGGVYLIFVLNLRQFKGLTSTGFPITCQDQWKSNPYFA